jgi:hypothetical protein
MKHAKFDASIGVATHVSPEEMGVVVIALNAMTPSDRASDFYAIKLRWTKAWEKHAPERYSTGVLGHHIESVAVTSARYEAALAVDRGDTELATRLLDAADAGDDVVAGLVAALRSTPVSSKGAVDGEPRS